MSAIHGDNKMLITIFDHLKRMRKLGLKFYDHAGDIVKM
jgi:hypothetical protein